MSEAPGTCGAEGCLRVNPQCGVERQRANVLIVPVFRKPRPGQVTRYSPVEGGSDGTLLSINTPTNLVVHTPALVRPGNDLVTLCKLRDVAENPGAPLQGGGPLRV